MAGFPGMIMTPSGVIKCDYVIVQVADLTAARVYLNHWTSATGSFA